MSQFNLEEARTNLPQLLEAAANGEEVLIVSANQQVIKLVPVKTTPPNSGNGKRRIKAGSAKGQVWMAPDFDAPLEDFEEYMP